MSRKKRIIQKCILLFILVCSGLLMVVYGNKTKKPEKNKEEEIVEDELELSEDYYDKLGYTTEELYKRYHTGYVEDTVKIIATAIDIDDTKLQDNITLDVTLDSVNKTKDTDKTKYEIQFTITNCADKAYAVYLPEDEMGVATDSLYVYEDPEFFEYRTLEYDSNVIWVSRTMPKYDDIAVINPDGTVTYYSSPEAHDEKNFIYEFTKINTMLAYMQPGESITYLRRSTVKNEKADDPNLAIAVSEAVKPRGKKGTMSYNKGGYTFFVNKKRGE